MPKVNGIRRQGHIWGGGEALGTWPLGVTKGTQKRRNRKRKEERKEKKEGMKGNKKKGKKGDKPSGLISCMLQKLVIIIIIKKEKR